MSTATLTEAQWQQRVIDYARLRGWLCWHQRPAQVRNGRWASAGTGDVGVPDLILARGGVVLAAELKRDSGKPSPGQERWLDALGPSGRLWRPRDWDDVQETLR